MSLVYEELAQKSRRLQKLFEEIEHHFDDPEVILVESHRLTEGLGVQIETSSCEPLIVDSLLREARCYSQGSSVTTQIKTLKESAPIEISVGNSPSVLLKPGQLHKKSLPDLLKADLWNRVILEKKKLPEVLALVAEYKQVERDGVKYYFDEDLDWLIEDDLELVTIYGKSGKHGLLKEVQRKVERGSHQTALENLRKCLEAEIDLTEKSLSSASFTQQRRELMILELATDTAAAEFLD